MPGLFSSKSGSNLQATLVFSDSRITLAAVLKSSTAYELIHFSEYPFESLASLAKQVKRIAVTNGFADANWNITLTPDQYQLLLVDVPDVPEEEIDNTLKFKAGDLLQYPVSEASISVFRLPDEAYRGRLKMAYIVAAKRSFIRDLKDSFGLEGILLNSIDIADMAYRNLGLLVSQKPSFAVLRLGTDNSYINCCYQGYMCLNRRVDVGVNQLTKTSASEGELTIDNLQIHLDSMALEIQRSLDYFESQLGLGSVPEILVIAPDGVSSEVMEKIDRSFQAKVLRMQPEQHLRISCDFSAGIFSKNSIALGGALRQLEGGV